MVFRREFRNGSVKFGIIAQLGEHLPYKQRVIGSSPIGPTIRDVSFWYAGVAELADAQDLKSCGTNLPYRFDSGRRHFKRLLQNGILWQDIMFVITEKDSVFRRIFCVKFDFAAASCVRVAQLDRALGYGPRCREFESSHVRLTSKQNCLEVFLFSVTFLLYYASNK